MTDLGRRELLLGGATLFAGAAGACRGEPPSGASGEARVDRPGLIPVTFVGGTVGTWRVDAIRTVVGEPLAVVERVDMRADRGDGAAGAWVLRGVAGQVRYVERAEKVVLDERSPPLARPEATRAALIPIRKSPAWWAMTQDERREIFEAKSRHIADTLRFLPRIARRLHHSRDLGEPFDFLTWFEFAPEHEAAFDELVTLLRGREEWVYVDHEVDVRLSR